MFFQKKICETQELPSWGLNSPRGTKAHSFLTQMKEISFIEPTGEPRALHSVQSSQSQVKPVPEAELHLKPLSSVSDPSPLTLHLRQRVRVREPPVLLSGRLHIHMAVEAHRGLLGVTAQFSQEDGRYWEGLTIRQLQRKRDNVYKTKQNYLVLPENSKTWR